MAGPGADSTAVARVRRRTAVRHGRGVKKLANIWGEEKEQADGK
jgi:hypothetical protein